MDKPETIKLVQQDNLLSLTDLWYLCLGHWKWFVLSLFITMTFALWNILSTEPSYTQNASVMIKEDNKNRGISSDVASAFSDMGIGMTSSLVENESEVFKSPDVILEVVRHLNLDMNYATDGRFHRTTLYGSNLPVNVLLPDLNDNQGVSFMLKLGDSNKFTISKIDFEGEELDDVISGSFGESLSSPMGRIIVNKLPIAASKDNAKSKISTIYVSKSDVESAVMSISNRLSVEITNFNMIISLSFTDVSIERAKAVINKLIEVYNTHWIEDKNKIATSTSMFINERLAVIENELGLVDSDISTYKSANLLTDVQAAGAMYMQQANKASEEMLNLNNQIYMARSIRSSLSTGNDVNKYNILPSNTGIVTNGVDEQINEFNTLLLKRNNFVANSSVNNPIVKDLDAQLVAMRQAICTSLDNLVTSLQTQIDNLQRYSRQTKSNIQANPSQAKNLLSVERQQKIKESLYLFLLQKREENELSKAFTAYNTRIVSTPYGSRRPTAPVKSKILLVAFLVGLFAPVVVLYVRESLNTTIRNRKEIEDAVNVPFLAEIPEMSPKRRFWQKKPQHTALTIYVKEGRRNVINEAFRILRTNLEFITDESSTGTVFCTTSFNPGNGKSFITLNSAVALAIKGRKVLLIDCDMRRATLSKEFGAPAIALSAYLAGKVEMDAIVTHDDKLGLDVIAAGAIPINPTELLYGARFKSLIDAYRDKYEYIFIDCPPSDIVADTSIIAKQCDRTIFVVRAGMLERNMLPKLQEDYETQRFPNMMLVLNGTVYEKSAYGSRYGYAYTYGYGYYGKEGGKYYTDKDTTEES